MPVRSKQARRRILETHELPPLPMMAGDLLELLQSDQDDDLEQLKDFLEHDPSLAARVLGWANSAYFGTQSNVRNLDRALFGVLGVRRAKSLLLSLFLKQVFDTRTCPHFDVTDYWYRALLTGECTKLAIPMRPGSPSLSPENGFLGGLFHNLGVLLLVHLFPERMDSILANLAPQDDSDLREAEEEAIGLDHSAAGARLGESWNLPEEIVAVMAHWWEEQPAEPLAAQVGFCRQQVDALLESPSRRAASAALEVPSNIGIPQHQWITVVEQLIQERGQLHELAKGLS